MLSSSLALDGISSVTDIPEGAGEFSSRIGNVVDGIRNAQEAARHLSSSDITAKQDATIPDQSRNCLRGSPRRELGMDVTKADLGFEKFERYRDLHYQFRFQGYLIRVHRRNVIHREDGY